MFPNAPGLLGKPSLKALGTIIDLSGDKPGVYMSTIDRWAKVRELPGGLIAIDCADDGKGEDEDCFLSIGKAGH